MLTVAAIKNLKPKEKPYRELDRDGLYLLVGFSLTVNRKACRCELRMAIQIMAWTHQMIYSNELGSIGML